MSISRRLSISLIVLNLVASGFFSMLAPGEWVVRAQHLEKKLVPYEHDLASWYVEKRVDNLWDIVAKANVNVVTTPRLNER